MSRPQEKIVDFDDRAEKARVLGRMGALRGKWRLMAAPYRPRRSLKANAFWWGCVLPAFQEFMRSHGQFFEAEEIHEFFLQKFAARSVIDPNTGEVLSMIGRRSSKMDTAEFSAFVNNAIGWMHDRYQIVVPEPDVMCAREPKPPRMARAAGAA